MGGMPFGDRTQPVKPLRFLLFTGSDYYPAGGWDDFKGSADTLEEALKAAKDANDSWVQIVDLETGEMINPEAVR